MRLSVVIVNWNSRDDLAACLQSLCVQTHEDLEVIVVDNGSKDDSVAMVRERYPHFKLLDEGENLGFAEGCNRGVAVSTGEWVAMLNNDTVADPRWAEALVTAAVGAPPALGMLQSLMLFKQRPDVVNSTGIELDRYGSGVDRGEGAPRVAAQEPAEIFCCCAGAAAYRRSMLEEIKLESGYFDKQHFMYSEDLDLGWRARLAGWSAWYVPASVVLHRYHGSSERHGPVWLQTMGTTNRVRTLLKNGSLRLIATQLPNVVRSSIELGRRAGADGLRALFRAIGTGLRTRAEVNVLCKQRRIDVEGRWLKKKRIVLAPTVQDGA
jgi:GT2 family glycosyltransferase